MVLNLVVGAMYFVEQSGGALHLGQDAAAKRKIVRRALEEQGVAHASYSALI